MRDVRLFKHAKRYTLLLLSLEALTNKDIKQLSVGYGSCALTFASESDKRDFINKEPDLLPEGLS
jgi:hypothetical protein